MKNFLKKMRNILSQQNNEKGFTLIELIVVIAVLGMIASIAIPKVGNITSRAREQADASNIQILQSAVERYNAENGDYPDEPDDLDGYIDKFPVQKEGSGPFYFDVSKGMVLKSKPSGGDADSKDFAFE